MSLRAMLCSRQLTEVRPGDACSRRAVDLLVLVEWKIRAVRPQLLNEKILLRVEPVIEGVSVTATPGFPACMGR